MGQRRISPALIAHGGAGGRGPAEERPERRRALLDAVGRGAAILRQGGSAVDAIQITVVELEDHPLFNAGTGSLLTTEGTVEMDASIMVGRAAQDVAADHRFSAGAVAVVSRVRNPIVLARAVMDETPHLMLAGSGAHQFARRAGIALCRNEDLITERARERWRARQGNVRRRSARSAAGHGTVGAVAIDSNGTIAAGTSTGGVPGKIPGRVGDSAIVGAGTFATQLGGASATGHGEAIIIAGLCREAISALSDGSSPSVIARRAIAALLAPLNAEGGIIIVDSRGGIGFAHNAAAMQVAAFHAAGGIRHFWVEPLSSKKSS
ncbi:MAG: isoaspartyl peptidase/L-asparaginase family protein [Candidatus Binataceae bacterium]